MSDPFIQIEVGVRYYGGTYIARVGKFQASCTTGPDWAARKCAAKAIAAEPRVLFKVEEKHVIIAGRDSQETHFVCRLYLGQPMESGVAA